MICRPSPLLDDSVPIIGEYLDVTSMVNFAIVNQQNHRLLDVSLHHLWSVSDAVAQFCIARKILAMFKKIKKMVCLPDDRRGERLDITAMVDFAIVNRENDAMLDETMTHLWRASDDEGRLWIGCKTMLLSCSRNGDPGI
jgi:hypothetical protein